jgi:hypothetical protein
MEGLVVPYARRAQLKQFGYVPLYPLDRRHEDEFYFMLNLIHIGLSEEIAVIKLTVTFIATKQRQPNG